jgi:hypothetical protein
MKELSRHLLLPVLAMTWLAAAPFPAAAKDVAKVDWKTPPKLTLRGLGEVKVGMTPKEVKALFSKVKELDAGGGTECYYLEPQGVPQGVSFMITDGRVSRIDITSSRYTSLSGATVGQGEKQVSKLYKGKLEVTPHHYDENGHYLTYVPTDKKDKNYRMVFETDGSKVTMFRTGKLPEVEFVEGCL